MLLLLYGLIRVRFPLNYASNYLLFIFIMTLIMIANFDPILIFIWNKNMERNKIRYNFHNKYFNSWLLKTPMILILSASKRELYLYQRYDFWILSHKLWKLALFIFPRYLIINYIQIGYIIYVLINLEKAKLWNWNMGGYQ